MTDRILIPSILFVCTANQCRSPIAAATFLQALSAAGISAPPGLLSAGTWTKSGLLVEPGIVELARSVGVDLSEFRTTSVDDVNLNAYEWIAVMEKSHQEVILIEHPELGEKVQLLSILAGKIPSDIPDPVQHTPDTAAAILKDLQDCVRDIARTLMDRKALQGSSITNRS